MRISRGVGTVLVLQCVAVVTASAQIATDGSVGPSVVLSGPNFTIGEVLGTRVGSNLFHSFTDFNVQTGQSATFTSNFAGNTSNVISRVTGANMSVIDGLLKSEIAGADFWLINPNGLMFGANAQIDVPAGFHASTADVLELDDGGQFRATDPNASSLTVAPPSAFGFLDATVGSLTVNGSQLAVGAGESLSLVGGAQTLTNAQLDAHSGRVDLVAVASTGRVLTTSVAGNALATTDVSAFANIDVGSSRIDVGTASASDAGTIGIVAGEVNLSSSRLSAGTTGSGSGGAIATNADGLGVKFGSTLDVSATATGDAGRVAIEGMQGAAGPAAASQVIVALQSHVLADSTGSGANAGSAGSIEIAADSMLVGVGSTLSASTVDGSGTGAGGAPVGSRIDLRTNDLLVEIGSEILANTGGAGQGGAILLTAADPLQPFTIQILEESSIKTVASGTGDAGSISLGSAVTPVDSIILAPGSREDSGRGLFSDTQGAGPDAGDAGSIVIHARNLRVTASDISVASGFFGQSDAGGDAGNIELHIGQLDLTRGGSIDAATNGTGQSGTITILGDYSSAPTITMVDGVITTSSRGSGDAGRIVIGSASAPFELIVARDVFPQSLPNDFPQGFDSRSEATGDAGDIEINTRSLLLRDGAQVAASTAAGSGGEILLRVDELRVERFGSISASTTGGDAGNIEITGVGGGPATSVTVTGTADAPGPDTGIFSSASGEGAAGDISITARDVVIESGAQVLAGTQHGLGSVVTFRVDSLTLLTGSLISGSTSGRGDAGEIAITGIDGTGPASTVTLALDSSIFSRSVTTGSDAGAAGNVEINTGSLQLADGSGIIANNVDGSGGTITIRADQVDISDSQVSVIALGQGDAGDISIFGAGSAQAASSVTISGESSGFFSSSNASGAAAGAAGSISVNALEMNLSNRGGIGATTVDGAGGAIDVQAESLDLGDGTSIAAGTFGAGDGGTIAIGVGDLTLDGGQIEATTSSTGNAGTISIAGLDGGVANRITLNFRPSAISTSAFSTDADSGDSGSIDIAAREISVRDGSQISSSTSGGGNGGSVTINVDTLSLSGIDSKVAVGTNGSGDAGNISIDGIDGAAATSIALSGESAAIRSDSSPIFGSPAELGAAGSISIRTQSLTLDDLATVSVQTSGRSGGAIDLGVGTLSVTDGAVVDARTLASGNAGDISIHGVEGGSATSVVVAGVSEGANSGLSARITSGSQGTGPSAGAAGNIEISAGAASITDSGFIAAETVDGLGGTIEMDVGNLTLSENGIVSTSTLGTGAGGSIVIAAADTVLLDGGRIAAQSTSTGPSAGSAGDISIAAGTVHLALPDAGETGIDASTVDGVGGSIALAVDTLQIDDGSIQASTSGSGNAGTITITGTDGVAANSVSLNNVGSAISTGSSSTSDDAGDAGSIDISARDIDVQDGARVSSDTSGGGSGGSIHIGVDALTVVTDAAISVGTTASGDAGNITIEGIAGAPATSVLVSGRMRRSAATPTASPVVLSFSEPPGASPSARKT